MTKVKKGGGELMVQRFSEECEKSLCDKHHFKYLYYFAKKPSSKSSRTFATN